MQHHEEDQDLGGQFQMMHGRLKILAMFLCKRNEGEKSISMSKIAFQMRYRSDE